MEQKEKVADILIRVMVPEDYDQVYRLWCGIKGFGIRSMDDSKEGVEKFLKRNPNTSVVAVDNGEIIGAILCGHDGRRGCFYHVCVKITHRKHGIGKKMAAFAMQKLQEELQLSYLFISHDINVIYKMSDRIMVMKDGKIVEIGDKEVLFTNPKEEYTKLLFAES